MNMIASCRADRKGRAVCADAWASARFVEEAAVKRCWNHAVLRETERKGEKSMRRKKRKLLHEYILLLAVVAAVVCLSFLITNTVFNDTARQEAQQSADVIFQQAEDRVTIFEEDIASLYMNVVRNVSVTNFFTADTVAERWDNLDGFLQVVGNNMRINQSLQNIMLYDEDDHLIAAKGDIFFPRQDGILLSGLSNFSDCIRDETTGETYFQVGMPMYVEQEKIGTVRVGAVYLLFDSVNLQGIVDGALANEESAVGILDRGNHLVVSSGKWEDSYAQETETAETNEYLIYVGAVGSTGWRIVSVVPKKSLFSGVSRMQWLNMLTYLVVLFALVLVCGVLSITKASASAAALGETMSASASSVLTTVASSAANYKTIELACMVLSALPLIILYPFAQKFFEKGVMVGSVKG